MYLVVSYVYHTDSEVGYNRCVRRTEQWLVAKAWLRTMRRRRPDEDWVILREAKTTVTVYGPPRAALELS